MRLRVVNDTRWQRCHNQISHFTKDESHAYTDEWGGYNGISINSVDSVDVTVARYHSTVQHGIKEWARDDDGDGVREVHINTMEGLWVEVRNFLRPFKGVHKCYLEGYVAICEWRINLKRISPPFICALVAQHFPLHSFCT